MANITQRARAVFIAALALVLGLGAAALAGSVNEERAATLATRGYASCTTTAVTVDNGAGGDAIPATPLPDRAFVQVTLLSDAVGSLYLSTGTPTSVNNFGALSADGSWRDVMGEDVTIKGLASSGTSISAKVLECVR